MLKPVHFTPYVVLSGPGYFTPKESIICSKHLVVWHLKKARELYNKYSSIYSPEFPLCKSDKEWQLCVHFDNNIKSLYLISCTPTHEIYHASVKFLYKDKYIAERNVTLESFKAHLIFSNMIGLIFQLCPHDTLTIVCNIRLVTKMNSKLGENNHMKLLTNEIFADLTIKVGEQKIKAHRSILVSHEYFNSILSENNNIIEIEDIDADIFHIILKYIYSGGATALKNAKQLFIAADKLKMDQLKLICETHLSETITFETAVDMLILAGRHSANELKTTARDFIVTHFYYVSLTDSWQSLMKTNADLVMEIFTQKFKNCNCFAVNN